MSRTRKQLEPAFCACGASITGRGKTGQCAACVRMWLATDPDICRRRTERASRAKQADPTYRQRIRETMSRVMSTPERREISRKSCVQREMWRQGVVAAQRPEVNAKRSRTVHERRMAWCPQELRAEYRRLVKYDHFPAAEARAIILAQHEKDMAAFRQTLIEQQPATIEPAELEG